MKKNLMLLFCLIFFQINIFGQKSYDDMKLNINMKFNDKPIVLAEKYISKNHDTLSFTSIKFYVSNFEILYSDQFIVQDHNYHLIDLESPESLSFFLKSDLKREIKSLRFNIGVDSLASVSGAMEGDLDPTKGMYWAWQSGYINLKIEGNSTSCNTRKNEFHFHIGGYLKPNYAIRTVVISAKKLHIENSEIHLNVDFAQLFNELSLRETNSIMIPGKDAMELADFSTKMFSIP